MDVVVQKLVKIEDIDVFFAELTAYNYVSAASSRFTYDLWNCIGKSRKFLLVDEFFLTWKGTIASYALL